LIGSGTTVASYALGRHKSWRYNKSIATILGSSATVLAWYLTLPKLNDIKKTVLHLESQATAIQDHITRTRINVEQRFDVIDTKISNSTKTAAELNHIASDHINSVATHDDVQHVADLIPPIIDRMDQVIDTSAKINDKLGQAAAPLSLIELIARQLGVNK